MGDMNYIEVLRDDGFRKIAAAIREATIDLQYRTNRKKDPKKSSFNIRYGLGEELRRSAYDNKVFIGALSEFILSYQEESYNVFSRTDGEEIRYVHIEESDFEKVVALVDKYGAKLVARMLSAAGYCTKYPEKQQKSNNDGNEVEQ